MIDNNDMVVSLIDVDPNINERRQSDETSASITHCSASSSSFGTALHVCQCQMRKMRQVRHLHLRWLGFQDRSIISTLPYLPCIPPSTPMQMLSNTERGGGKATVLMQMPKIPHLPPSVSMQMPHHSTSLSIFILMLIRSITISLSSTTIIKIIFLLIVFIPFIHMILRVVSSVRKSTTLE